MLALSSLILPCAIHCKWLASLFLLGFAVQGDSEPLDILCAPIEAERRGSDLSKFGFVFKNTTDTEASFRTFARIFDLVQNFKRVSADALDIIAGDKPPTLRGNYHFRNSHPPFISSFGDAGYNFKLVPFRKCLPSVLDEEIDIKRGENLPLTLNAQSAKVLYFRFFDVEISSGLIPSDFSGGRDHLASFNQGPEDCASPCKAEDYRDLSPIDYGLCRFSHAPLGVKVLLAIVIGVVWLICGVNLASRHGHELSRTGDSAYVLVCLLLIATGPILIAMWAANP